MCVSVWALAFGEREHTAFIAKWQFSALRRKSDEYRHQLGKTTPEKTCPNPKLPGNSSEKLRFTLSKEGFLVFHQWAPGPGGAAPRALPAAVSRWVSRACSVGPCVCPWHRGGVHTPSFSPVPLSPHSWRGGR